MLELFDKRYKAISNVFVETYTGEKYIFPAPIYIYGTIENETKNLKNRLEIRYDSFWDSLFILDYHFSFFAYLLTFEYRLETILIQNLIKKECSSDAYGYKGSFQFLNEDVILNISDDEVYDQYKQIYETVLNDN